MLKMVALKRADRVHELELGEDRDLVLVQGRLGRYLVSDEVHCISATPHDHET